MEHLDSSPFGKLVLASGYATKEQILECLRMQKSLEKADKRVPRLGELLAAKKYMTAEQVRDVLRKQQAEQKAPPPSTTAAPAAEVVGHQLTSGQTFGKFVVHKRLGYDSLSTIYLASQAADKSIQVALHVADPEVVGAEPGGMDALRERAAKVAELRHDAVQHIVACGEAHDHLYYAAPYIEGLPLSQVLSSRGKLDVPFALEICTQVAQALEYSHARGVFHPEIRPASLLVTPERQVKIMAFGMAATTATGFAWLTEREKGLSYPVSPEMAVEEGTKIVCDARTDIFSLGITLYQLLTGRPPFDGESMSELLFSVGHDEPADPTLLNPDLTPELSEVLQTMMQKDPDARYQNATLLLNALTASGVTAQPASTPSATALRMRSAASTTIPPVKAAGKSSVNFKPVTATKDKTGKRKAAEATSAKRGAQRRNAPTGSRHGAEDKSPITMIAIGVVVLAIVGFIVYILMLRMEQEAIRKAQLLQGPTQNNTQEDEEESVETPEKPENTSNQKETEKKPPRRKKRTPRKKPAPRKEEASSESTSAKKPSAGETVKESPSTLTEKAEEATDTADGEDAPPVRRRTMMDEIIRRAAEQDAQETGEID